MHLHLAQLLYANQSMIASALALNGQISLTNLRNRIMKLYRPLRKGCDGRDDVIEPTKQLVATSFLEFILHNVPLKPSAYKYILSTKIRKNYSNILILTTFFAGATLAELSLGESHFSDDISSHPYR